MAGNGDMKAHESTYAAVTGLLKYGAIACAIGALLLMWVISK